MLLLVLLELLMLAILELLDLQELLLLLLLQLLLLLLLLLLLVLLLLLLLLLLLPLPVGRRRLCKVHVKLLNKRIIQLRSVRLDKMMEDLIRGRRRMLLLQSVQV